MLKRSMIALAVVALLATGLQAGELKVHNWPCVFQALEMTSIPVVVDIGYYVVIPDQTKLKIKLAQNTSSFKDFQGCLNQNGVKRMIVKTNFDLELSASVNFTVPTDGKSVHLAKNVDEDYTGPSSLTITSAESGVGISVCVKLTGKGNGETLAAISALGGPGSTKEVGRVNINVKPSATYGCGTGDINTGNTNPGYQQGNGW